MRGSNGIVGRLSGKKVWREMMAVPSPRIFEITVYKSSDPETVVYMQYTSPLWNCISSIDLSIIEESMLYTTEKIILGSALN